MRIHYLFQLAWIKFLECSKNRCLDFLWVFGLNHDGFFMHWNTCKLFFLLLHCFFFSLSLFVVETHMELWSKCLEVVNTWVNFFELLGAVGLLSCLAFLLLYKWLLWWWQLRWVVALTLNLFLSGLMRFYLDVVSIFGNLSSCNLRNCKWYSLFGLSRLILLLKSQNLALNNLVLSNLWGIGYKCWLSSLDRLVNWRLIGLDCNLSWSSLSNRCSLNNLGSLSNWKGLCCMNRLNLAKGVWCRNSKSTGLLSCRRSW